MGLALWLTSSSPLSSSLLASHIHALSSSIPGASQVFPPHVTLLSGLEAGEEKGTGMLVGELWEESVKAMQRWKQMATDGGDQGLEVAFKDCETRGKYFQSILLSLVPTPALVSLHTTLLEEHTSLSSFSADKPIPKAFDYFPHLSLVYSNLSSSEAQAKIDELKKTGVIIPSPCSPSASSIDGTKPSSDDQGGVTITQPANSATTSEAASDAGERPRLSRLTLDRVQLWDCTGPVEGWKMVKQVDLADL